MANTYKLISSVTVGALGATSIDFTSIPATYTDLQLVLSGRSIRADERDSIELTFNNNTANYETVAMRGDGASAGASVGYSSASIQRADMPGATATANSFSNISFYISNYAGSTYKYVDIESVYENNTTYAFQILGVGTWSNTAAITSIKIKVEIGPTIVQYSTAYLYGISNA
jgi:hypothetical protein